MRTPGSAIYGHWPRMQTVITGLVATINLGMVTICWLLYQQALQVSTRGSEAREPVSSEISYLCEISDLLLFFSYFASQNNEIKSGNYFFDVCRVNWSIWLDVKYPQQAFARE